MPCQSYESNWAHSSSDSDVKRLKKEADKLARFACAAMEELIKHGKADFLILKNEELREWWEQHQIADRKAREAEERKQRRAQVKADALSKLTEEEKEALGLKRVKKLPNEVMDEDYLEDLLKMVAKYNKNDL